MITLVQALKAASFIMAKKDIRYFLNDVHIVKRDGVVTVEATNGHMGFQTRDVNPELIDVEELDVIIPNDIVNIVIKAKNVFIKDGSFVSELSTIQMSPAEGNYPQMDRVIPQRTATVTTDPEYSLNPEYVMAVGKSFKAVTGRKDFSGLISRNIANGDNGALSSVLMYPNIHELSNTNWVVMPIRLK